MSRAYHRGEMTFAEIGRRLGISPAAAADTFYRAARKLRVRCPFSLEYLKRLSCARQEALLAAKGAQS